ncbi:MAG: hypothetical protein ABEI77_05655 [Halorientalis sp.]
MSDQTDSTLAGLQRPLCYVMGLFYTVAGVMHFVVPDAYEQVVPPPLPAPGALVSLSGIAEIVLGIGMLFERTRELSAWGIIGLLIAVFPSNVYMATADVELQGVPEWASDPSETAMWARLPLQGVLIIWEWWYTKPMADEQ